MRAAVCDARARLAVAFAWIALACACGNVAPDADAPGVPLEVQLEGGELPTENLRRHVEFLASAPRDSGSPQLLAARTYCAEQLRNLGYWVQTQDVGDGSGQNVLGVLWGSSRPLEQVLVSAHLDSVSNCRGADDNASGVAGALEVARLLAQGPHARSLVVACWDLEEQNLGGSLTYALGSRFYRADVRMSFVLEMIGYKNTAPNSQRLPVSADLEPTFAEQFPDTYRALVDNERRGDFIALVADAPFAVTFDGSSRYVRAFQDAANGVGLRVLSLELSTALMLALPDMTRSDHASFWASGYSAMMITDTAELRNPNYHCAGGADTPDTLDYDFAAQIAQATASAAAVALDD